MNKHFIYLVFILLVSSFYSPAQTVVGVWKSKGNLLIMDDGTKKDMQKTLLKAMPCQADIKYVFTSTGELYSQTPENCGPGGDMTRATYKISGNALTVIPKMGLGTGFLTTYTVAFKDDQLILSHEYTKAEKSALHSRAKEIIITYQRI
jgi:hypothetical protein